MQGLYENFYWYVYVNIIWICKKWMMHILEIHGELVRNLLSCSEYFFLSYNKLQMGPRKSEVSDTFNWSENIVYIYPLELEYQTSCHKYRHFTHVSNRLLAPQISPFPTPNFSVCICYDMTFLPSQWTLMGLFHTYLIPFFLRKIRVRVNQGFISFFNAITEGFTPFKNCTGSSWG